MDFLRKRGYAFGLLLLCLCYAVFNFSSSFAKDDSDICQFTFEFPTYLNFGPLRCATSVGEMLSSSDNVVDID